MKKQTVILRDSFNYDADSVSLETGLTCDDVSLTKQSFADECDINKIVERFLHTGQLPQNVSLPQFGDYSQTLDYQTALNLVIEAQDAFMQFPHDVRARFSNDPAQFLDFVNNPDNIDEAIKLGIFTKKLDISSSSDNNTPANPANNEGT